MTRNSLVSRQKPIGGEIDITDVDERIRIDAKILIPGRGDPIENGTLVCGSSNASDIEERGKILYAGATSDLPSKYGKLNVLKVPVVMPGLWDCHVSFSSCSISVSE